MILIGGEGSDFSSLEKALIDGGATVKITTYKLDLPVALKSAPSLIVLDTIADKSAGIQILNSLRQSNVYKKIPILVQVEDSNEKIQSVLTLGASDYFLESEPSEMVETKVQILLGHANNFAGSRIVHIPPDENETVRKGIKVLVVEDDLFLQSLLKERFEKAGLEYVFCANGLSVAAKVKEFKPEVIILDLMLPDKSGLEILAELKRDEAAKSIPVIVFSNKDTEDEKSKAKELGAENFFVKVKTDLSELIHAMNKLV